MPKDQPTKDEATARAAWEAALRAYQPHSARTIRAWLEHTRDLTQRVLNLGAYDETRDGPKRLDPKSPAWRTKLALAAPLNGHERGDLELIVRLTDELLSRLDAHDDGTVTTLSLTLDLVQAEARAHGALIYRVHAADLEDGRRWQKQDMRLLRWSRIGGREKRKAEAATLESVARECRRLYPRASWSWVCTRKIAPRVNLSPSRVRHLLPAAVWAKARATG
jgi:hypothetical protein